MRFVGAIAAALWLSGLFCQPAEAEKRIALAIGNANYRNVVHLSNPANDAAMLAETFKKANFDVVSLRSDLSASEMRRALRDFGDQARDADIAVIYYAGHGLEVDGVNYLIPVDAVLDRDTDIYDEALPLDRLMVAVEPARQLRLVILDACRDNPFAKSMKRSVAQRGIGRGLARVDPTSPNTVIAFAAKAGFTAFDGDAKNSPYAVALAAHLTMPGLDVRKAFGFVRDEVLKATSNRQEPFIYGSLGGDDIALVPAPAVAPPAPARGSNEAIRRDYQFAERVGTRQAWSYFLSTYPDGFYSKLAAAQISKLDAEEKARRAAEEKARLAAEGAKAVEQARAAAEAKAAEETRLAAEQRKAQEEARVAEAERTAAAAQAKADALQKALEEVKASEAQRAKAADAKAADDKAAEARAADKPSATVALISPADRPAGTDPADQTPRLLQTELRRLGCYTGSVDGNWSEATQRSLSLFNKSAGTKLDTKTASLDTLDVLQKKNERVCPLVCEHGYKPDGDICTRIICKAGYEVGDDNTCERAKDKKPAARRAPGATPTYSGEGGARCAANSCSAAYAGCMRHAAAMGRRGFHCQSEYSSCLSTGEFIGRRCQRHGLARN